MLYTKQQVQDNIRNRQGKRVFYLGKDDLLTSEAKDYLSEQRIQILPAHQAAEQRFRAPDGAIYENKPEHMTHLNGEILVPKTHPRIRFRGGIDTLESAILLCQNRYTALEQPLQQVLELARRLIRCDVLDEPVGDFALCGLTQEQQREQSHFPQKHFGIAHFMPDCRDTGMILELNKLRCLTRNAELLAVEAFADQQGIPTRTDILQAMNRMSSMLYILMLREKANQMKRMDQGE